MPNSATQNLAMLVGPPTSAYQPVYGGHTGLAKSLCDLAGGLF